MRGNKNNPSRNDLKKQFKIRATHFFLLGALATSGISTLASAQVSNSTAVNSADLDGQAFTLPAVDVIVENPYFLTQTEGSSSYNANKTTNSTGLALSPRETPQSVSVITNQRLKDQAFTQVADALNYTNGISGAVWDQDRFVFSSRGFPISRMLYDGVPTPFSDSYGAGETQLDPILFDHIEVTRGAAGLAQGVGDPSAAVNFVRKRANSRELQFEASVGIGTRDFYRGTFDLSTPLFTDGKVRARFVGALQKNHYQRQFQKKTQVAGLATIEADLTDSTLLRFGYYHQYTSPHNSMWGGYPWSDIYGHKRELSRHLNLAANWSRWPTRQQGAYIGLEQLLSDDWKVSAQLSYQRNQAYPRLMAMPANYDERGEVVHLQNPHTGFLVDNLGNLVPPHFYRGLPDRITRSVDVRANGNFELFGREHELTFGGSFDTQRDYVDGFRVLNGDEMPAVNFKNWKQSYPEPKWSEPYASRRMKTYQRSLYTALRLNPLDWLHIIGGARWTAWELDNHNQFTHERQNFTKHRLIPYAGLLIDFNDQLTGYFSYTSIFLPTTERSPSGEWLDPTTGDSYELGLKGSFFDDKLDVAASVFQINQDNLTETIPGTFVQDAPENTFASRSIDGTRSRGYEIEVSGSPIDNWNINASLSHWTGRDKERNPIQTDQPRTLFKLFTTYRLPGVLNNLTIGGGLNWRSATYNTAPNAWGYDYKYRESAYGLVDLMAKYDFNDRTALQVNANNIFDKKYSTCSGCWHDFNWGEGTNVKATLTFKY